MNKERKKIKLFLFVYSEKTCEKNLSWFIPSVNIATFKLDNNNFFNLLRTEILIEIIFFNSNTAIIVINIKQRQ